MLSGPAILLRITLEWSINLQTISRRVIDRVLNTSNDSPSSSFQSMLLLENSQVVLAAVTGWVIIRQLNGSPWGSHV